MQHILQCDEVLLYLARWGRYPYAFAGQDPHVDHMYGDHGERGVVVDDDIVQRFARVPFHEYRYDHHQDLYPRQDQELIDHVPVLEQICDRECHLGDPQEDGEETEEEVIPILIIAHEEQILQDGGYTQRHTADVDAPAALHVAPVYDPDA